MPCDHKFNPKIRSYEPQTELQAQNMMNGWATEIKSKNYLSDDPSIFPMRRSRPEMPSRCYP